MVIVVGTNVLVASLIHGGIVNRVMLSNPGTWAVPDHCLQELWRHRDVWNRGRVPDARLAGTLAEFAAGYLSVYGSEAYEGSLDDAVRLVKDPDDAPVVALALSMENEGIWTYNPRDYAPAARGGRVELLTTARVASMYPPDSMGP